MTALFGTALPIVQAPMAGSQGSALAGAVSRAGGLGALPTAQLGVAALRVELAALRGELEAARVEPEALRVEGETPLGTGRAARRDHPRLPINVNFFCHVPPSPDAEREAAWRAVLAPYYEEWGIDPARIPAAPGRTPFSAEAARVLEEFRPAVVSFHFGLPDAALMARVRALGATIISSATTVEEARWLEARGVDAIIAQGREAGGHRGHFLSDDLTLQAGTFALLPQIVRAVRVPVIAAGGIVDRRTVSAALTLGAAAVQVGTAYLLCPEATTSPPHRAALAAADAHHTALTNLFSGRPARGIVNRLMRELGPLSDEPPAFPLAAAALAPLRARAEAQGRGDFSPLWAGENVSGCTTKSAADLTRTLAGV